MLGNSRFFWGLGGVFLRNSRIPTLEFLNLEFLVFFEISQYVTPFILIAFYAIKSRLSKLILDRMKDCFYWRIFSYELVYTFQSSKRC